MDQENTENLPEFPTGRSELGITPIDEALGISVKPPRRGRLTKKGIDQRLMQQQQQLERELAKLARQFKKVEKIRKSILRLRSWRMTATEALP